MIENIRIVLFQMDTLELGLTENLDKIKKLVEDLNGDFDLLILPEMFNVGYVLDTQLLEEKFQLYTNEKLVDICKKYDICILGSIPTKRDSLWYNTMCFFDADGALSVYDKIHLFGIAGEKDHYSSGTNINVINFKGWEIQPLICYDLRFPYIVNTKTHPDILIYSAQWPAARSDHWKSLLKARAIEHQSYVIGVNRWGVDSKGFYYSGDSVAFDSAGNPLGICSEEETYIGVTLEYQTMNAYRQKFPFLDDWQY